MFRKPIHSILFLAISVPVLSTCSQAAQSGKNAPETIGATKVLLAPEAAKVLPDAVFFRGQSAPIQGRNSGGVQFAKGAFFLVALVDTSGYSSSVQEKYQAYLITETAIDIEGHRLEPGSYGCGFIAGNNFIVMDIGGHNLFSVHSATDSNLRRPTPLQVLAVPGGIKYRLYFGREYINFAQSAPK